MAKICQFQETPINCWNAFIWETVMEYLNASLTAASRFMNKNKTVTLYSHFSQIIDFVVQSLLNWREVPLESEGFLDKLI